MNEYLVEVAQALRGSTHGARAQITAEACRVLQCSQPTLYRKLRAAGWNSGRQLRADRGDSKVPYDELAQLGAMWASAGAQRLNGKWLRTIDDVISIARANGVLSVDVSASTVLRLLQIHGLHRQHVSAPTPHVRMRSLHPNHVWQLDPSLCVVYYSKRDGLRVLDEKKYYKNKPDQVAKYTPLRVWRYVAVDHFSGAVFARYYEAVAENQDTLFDFLMESMSPSDPRHLMRGVPHCLVWDAGSANTSFGIQQLLTQLLVRHWPHMPGNSRAKGSVEQGNNLVETRFESRLPFQKVPCVEELNAHLGDWLVMWNATREHSRHGHTRYGLWQTITQAQLRLRPDRDTCRLLVTSKPESRTVRGDLTIQFALPGHGTAFYPVDHVPGVRVNDLVQVVAHRYRAPAICIVQPDEDGRIRYIECEPMQTVAGGFSLDGPIWGESYARHADTPADEARKSQAEAAYGTRDLAEADKRRRAGMPAFGGQIDPFKDVREAAAAAPAHMARKGSELHLPNPVQVELKPLTVVQALFALRERLARPISPAERELVGEWYPNDVPETDIDALCNRLLQRPQLTIVR